MQIKNKINNIKAVVIPMKTKINQQTLFRHISWYSSLLQIYCSHLHIQIFSHQYISAESTSKILQLGIFEEDDSEYQQQYLNILPQNTLLKKLNERASKITLADLKQICFVETKQWGKSLLFQHGKDILVVWATINGFPILNFLPSKVEFLGENSYLIQIVRQQLGCSFYKHKNRKQLYLKQAYMNDENIGFTVFIIDFNENYLNKNKIKINDIIKKQMNVILKQFEIISKQRKKQQKLNQYMQNISKISQILMIDKDTFMKKMFKFKVK